MFSLAESRETRGYGQALVVAIIATLLVLFPTSPTPSYASGFTPLNGNCELSGDGKSGTEYRITDSAALYESVDCATGRAVLFKLTDDIIFPAGVNTPIGYSSLTTSLNWAGSLIGQDFEISGFEISIPNLAAVSDINSSSNGAGLFWGLGNISFSNVTFRGTVQSNIDSVGGLAGYSTGDMYFESVVADIDVNASTTASDEVGGFVGYADGYITFSNSVNQGDVSGYRDVGGFVGEVQDPQIDFISSGNTGNIEASSSSAGGFVGYLSNDIDIHISTNSGDITGSRNVGGFVGYVDEDARIYSSSNEGDVTGDTDNIGGFVGFIEDDVWLRGSSNYGNVSGASGSEEVAGFFGYVKDDVYVFSSFNYGNVTGTSEVGGFVGYVDDEGFFQSSENLGNISGVSEVGGFVGDVDDGRISLSTNSGTISGDTRVGGFFGNADDDDDTVVVEDSANSGTIIGISRSGGVVGWAETDVFIQRFVMSGEVQGGIATGGLVGEFDGDDLSVREVLVSGGIIGTDSVGGFVGLVNDIFSSDSFVSSAISGNQNVGGIAGQAYDVNLANTLFAGTLTVTDRTAARAFVASSSGSVSASASYWALAANSDLAAAPAGVDYSSVDSGYLAPAVAYNAASYIDWNFTSIWGFGSCSVNNGLPTLRFAEPSATSQTQTGACFIPPTPVIPSIPSVNFVGPMIESVTQNALVGGTVEIRGARLETITKVFVGGEEVSFKLESNNLVTFAVPKLNPGVYQTVFYSALAQVNLTGKITILGSSADLTRVNVGSFNGKLVVYAINLDGSRITWKVGGIWGQDTAVGNQLNRFDRLTPRKGVTVKVDIFVNGIKRMSKNVLTR